MATFLLVEDDITFTRILSGFLKKQGHSVEVKHRFEDGIKAIQENTYDILLVDYRLPDGTGMDLLIKAREKSSSLPVIMMTSFNDIRTAVSAIRSGAFDFITKPVNPDELLMVINDALNKKELPSAPAKVAVHSSFVEGVSDLSRQLHDYIKLVAPTDMSVLIEGESGTGKENVARTIHNLSKRSKAPFIAIDCGAISRDLAASELFGHIKGAFTGALQDKKGQFEAADGGTLFLDEIGNLSYEVQVKLLRALRERVIQPIGSTKQIKVDVRIIAATNEDLIGNTKTGDFREDLYHRLNEFKIKVPALRYRGDDLDIFIEHFIRSSNKELGKNVLRFSDDVMEIFHRYDWPGNLRELKNVVKRAVLLTKSDVAGKETLPDDMDLAISTIQKPEGPDLKALQDYNERDMILKTLQEVRYNKSKAAKLLNIDRKTLYNKMAKYNIEG